MQLDIEQPDQLLAYLRSTHRITPNEVPAFHVLSGGVSNRTVYIKRQNGDAWVMKQALSKLRVPVDWFSDPTRVHIEAAGLRWLSKLAPPNTVPALIFEDHTHHLLAMEAVPKPHENWKTLLLDGQLQIDLITQFGQLLATIHQRAYAQRDAISSEFDDRAIFNSLRLEAYYSYTAEQVPEAESFMRQIHADTLATRITLVHGDYSPKNILVHANKLVCLDFEVIHFGDPAFDLGFSMTHFLSKAHYLPQHRQAFAHACRHYWQTYRHTMGDLGWAEDLEARAVRHTLACMLARVAGRSPLEYMDSAARQQQQTVVIMLMADPPLTVKALTERFCHILE